MSKKPKKQKISFEDMARLSLEANAGTRKELTNREYRSDVENILIPYFADLKIGKITPLMLKVWQTQMLKTKSPKRVNNLRIILSTIFKDARMSEFIAQNPLELVPKPKNTKPTINPLLFEEVEKVVNYAQENDPWFANVLIVACFTGMRTGELLALEWCDVDFQNNKISINKSIRKGLLSTPKTQGSVREIDMLPPVKEALLKLKNDTKWVFVCSYTGVGLHNSTHMLKKWKRTLKACGLEYRTFYETRHTFASIMISKGENILWVSAMLGHTQTSMTLNRYSKYRDDKQERATWLKITS